MLWILLAEIAAAQELAPPPRMTGPVNTYFSGSDYPKEALRHGWEGAVVADITVGPEGRVSDCKIAQSSGHQLLDDTTCKIIVTRARFIPARDKDGKAVWDRLRTPPIIWKLR
jgi:periplasmic protein TonB